MTAQLRDSERREYTQWKLKRIKVDPLERLKPTTAREIKKFREETK